MRNRRKQMHDRLLALVLVIALTISLMPSSLMPVRADETETAATDVTATTTDASGLSTETDANVGTPYYFTVAVKDSSGNPIEGATVSFGTPTDADTGEELATNTDAGTGTGEEDGIAASEHGFPVEVTTDADGQASIDLGAYSEAILAACGISAASAASLLTAANGSGTGVAMQIAVNKDGVQLYNEAYTLTVSGDGTISSLSVGNVLTCTVSASVTTANSEADPAYEIVLATLDAEENGNDSQTLASADDTAVYVAGAKVSVTVSTDTEDYYLSEAKVMFGEGENRTETALTIDATDKTTAASGEGGIELGGDAVIALSFVKTYDVTVTTVTVSDDDTYTAATGGTVKLDDTQVNGTDSAAEGTSVYSATEDSGSQSALTVAAADGYVISQLSVGGVDRLDEVTEDGSGLEVYSGTVTVNSDTDIYVTFVKIYTVTVTVSEGGDGTASYEIKDDSAAITSGGTVDVELGDEITVTAAPNANYRVETFTVTNGEAEVSGVKFDDGQNGTTETFEARNDDDRTATWTPGEDATVTITFMYNLYTVDVNLTADEAAGATTQVTVNGTVLEAGVTSAEVRYSQDVEVKLTWDEADYYLDNDTVIVTAAGGTTVDFISSSTDESTGVAVLKIAGTSVTDDITVAASIKEENTANASVSGYVNTLTGGNGETVYVYAEAESAAITAPDGYAYVSLDAKSATTAEAKTIETISLSDLNGSNQRTISAIYFGKVASGDGIDGIVWSAVDTTSYIIVFDTTDPSASLTLNDENAEEIYGSNVTFSVTATDSAAVYNSGVAGIDWWVGTEADETATGTTVTNLYTYKTGDGAPQESVAETFTVDAAAYAADGLTVTVKVTDLAGNTYYRTSDAFDIDTTAPVISVSYDDTDDAGNVVNPVSNDKYFASTRTATVVITEDHFDSSNVVITITAEDADGNELEDSASTYTISGWTDKGTGAEATHTATITYGGDANYTFAISYTDEAGNEADNSASAIFAAGTAAPTEFTVDTTNPTGKLTIATSTWDALLSVITFGLYSKTTVTVSALAQDATSGIDKIQYYVVKVTDKDSASAAGLTQTDLDAIADGDWATVEDSEFTFTSGSNETFVVYAKLTDKAGNYSYINNSTAYITDQTAPTVTITPKDEADFTSEVEDAYGFNGVNHAESVILNVTVSDLDSSNNTSGIRSVTYTVKKDGSETQSGTLYSFASAGSTELSYDALTKTYEGTITVDSTKNNSCNVVVEVTVTDNAGNETTESIKLDIDITAPTIAVTYDNNTAAHDSYFSNTRTATIMIVEKSDHFDADTATAGIKITAVDANGEEVTDANGEALVETLLDDITWSTTGTGDTAIHSAKIVYSADANYTFTISYTDEAGNTSGDPTYAEETVAAEAFTIDKTTPTGSVSVGNYTWEEFLNLLSMGLYDSSDNASVSVSAKDATGCLESVNYCVVSYSESDAAAEGETEKVVQLTEDEMASLGWTVIYDCETASANVSEFTQALPDVTADTTVVVYLKVIDFAGNVLYLSSDGYILDTTAAAITLAPTDEEDFISEVADAYGFNLEHEDGIEITVSADDTDDNGNYSGIAKITYTVTNTDTGIETQSGTVYENAYSQSAYAAGSASNPTYSELEQSVTGTFTVETANNNNCDIEVTVTVTDNAGNESTESILLDIDVTAPTATISYVNNSAYNEKYFDAVRSATILVTERSAHFDAAKATESITITAVDADGNTVENAYTIGSWTTVLNEGTGATANASMYFLQIQFTKDANYTLSFDYTDSAGNAAESVNADESVAPYDFTIDTVDPYGTVTITDQDGSTAWSSLLSVITFGLYDSKSAEVTIEAGDATSEIKSIAYYTVSGSDAATTLTAAQLDALDEDAWTAAADVTTVSFTKESDETFTVYARITDYTEHYIYVSSDGYIIDKSAPTVTTFVPADAVDDTTGVADATYTGDFVSGTAQYGFNEDHASGVDIAIAVSDLTGNEYSGLQSVEYTVTCDDVTTQSGTVAEGTALYSLGYYDSSYSEGSESNPAYNDLLTSWSGSITVEMALNNGSNVVVTLTVTDNAGNVTEKSITLDIDVTAPTIDITYDNNTARNDTYFDATRTATVVITERTDHFDAEAATDGITITAVDADGNAVISGWWVGNWTTAEDENGDVNAATHTATIYYGADANYTFAISYTDKAGNDASVSYAYGTVAEEAFAVDTTNPTGQVTISGADETSDIWTSLLSILTFGLYDDERADVALAADDATSPIESIKYYVVSGSAAATVLDYKALDELAEEAWTTENDTENVTFTKSSDDTFVVYTKITDYAGNYIYLNSDGYIVDTTAPVEISIVPADSAGDGYTGDFTAESADYGFNATHEDGIDLDINVSDISNDNTSGIRYIEYWVTNNDTGVVTQSGTVDGTLTYDEGALYDFDYDDADYAYETSEDTVTGNTAANPDYSTVTASGTWSGTITVYPTTAAGGTNNNCSVTVTVKVTDNAGNVSEKSITLDIDVTAPTIEISYDNNDAEHDSYFDNTRTATIVITERTSHFDAETATDGITITAYDAYGEEVADGYTISDWTTEDATGSAANTAAHTATISYEADANYTFVITYTDEADNTAVQVTEEDGTVLCASYAEGTAAPEAFTVDRSKATATVTIDDYSWTEFLERLSMGLYDADDEAAEVSVDTQDDTSPLDYVGYYIVTYDESDAADEAEDGTPEETVVIATADELRAFEWITLYNCEDPTASEGTLGSGANTYYEQFLSVDPDETFVIYVKVVDYAGNTLYISSDGYILDTTAAAITTFVPSDALDEDGNEISGYYGDFESESSDYGFNLKHKDGIEVTIDVTDVDADGNYSGIQKIEYRVIDNDVIDEKTGETKVTDEGVLFDYTGADYGYEQSAYETDSEANPTYSELVTDYSGTITVNATDNNDCNITVILTVTDNAGNVSAESFTLDIDVTSPTVTVTYDDTADDVRNDNYFLDTRTSEIVVIERSTHFEDESVEISITAVDAEGNTIVPSEVVSVYNTDPETEGAEALACYTDEDGTVNTADFAAAAAGWTWTQSTDEDSNVIYLLSVKGWFTVEGATENDATHTIYIVWEGDANYTFDIDYTDNAGDDLDRDDYLVYEGVNDKAYTEFTVDLTNPTGTINIEDQDQTNVWDTLLSILTFGLYDNSKADVTLNAYDETSPIETLKYYVVTGSAAATVLSYDDLEALDESVWTSNKDAEDRTVVSFEVAQDETLVVYAKITDYAGNYIYLCSDGYIVDQTAPVVTTFAPADDSDFTSDTSDYGFNLTHEDGVDVEISVTDVTGTGEYSGISKVEYWVVNEDVIDETTGEGTETQRETLYDNNYSDTNYSFETDEENAGGNAAEILSHEDLLTEFSKTVTVYPYTEDGLTNNNCNITVYLGVTDNAGNYTEKSFTVDIDVTAPIIAISYDNNAAEHEKYFDNTRTATIVITERTSHFDADTATAGITVTAYDAYGEEVTDGYTISGWTTADASGTAANTATHTATIYYEADANYTFAITYTDEAGNTAEQIVEEDGTVLCAEYKTGTVAPEEFTVDKTTATGTVTIDDCSWTDFVEKLAMGLYDADEADAEVTVDTQDATSPLDFVGYFITYYDVDNTDIATALTKAELDAAENWITLYDYAYPSAAAGTLGSGANTYYEQFLDVTPDATFVIYLKVVDYAGNVLYVSSDGYILDTTVADINTFAPQDAQDFVSDTSDYGYNLNHEGGIKVDIDVDDVDENGNYSGLKTVEYWVVNNDTGAMTQNEVLFDYAGNDYGYEQDDYEVDSENTPTYGELVTGFADTITVETADNNNCNITVYLGVTDNAGNYTEQSFTLDIDVTAPTIDISYDNNTARNDSYFADTRTATIVITERTSHFDADVATAGITITAYDAYGNEVTIPAVNGWTTKNATGSAANTATHTATIEYLADANYTFAITYTDNAGNEASLTYATGTVAPEKFTVDLTDPFGSVTMTDDDQTNTWTTLLSVLTFGLYDDSRVKVDIAAEDATSLIESIKYYIVSGSAAATKLTATDLDALVDSSWTTTSFAANTAAVNFTRSADETLVVYVKLTDYAGNYYYISSDGYIVDATSPTITTLQPADTQDFASETAQYGFNLNHSSGVKINIAASDVTSSGNYSGIQSVEYWVTCDGTTTQSGTVADGNALYNFGYYDTSYADSAVSNPTYSSLKTDWSGSITVDAMKNNSCDVTVTVKVTDNAGNSTTKSITLDIDVTAPTISFSYDNNTARNSKYFDASRTATIVITERTSHFSAANATAGITITAVDSSGNAVTVPTVSSWRTVSGSTADAATHTATINYTTDANYTFAITYTDNAGNTATQIISTSTAPYDFAVDKTAPTATVTATSAEGSTQTWRSVISSLTFGFVSKDSISVAGTSQDATSPIESVKYYKTSAATAMTKTQLTALSSSSWTAVSTSSRYANYTLPTVTSDEQFTYYLQITDYAGNVTYISTNGLIVDETDPRTETIAPVVTISQPINGIYNESDNVTVDVQVEDPTVNGTYSGLYEIHYEIYSLGELTESGVLYQFNNSDPTQSELKNIWTGTITIHTALSGNNSNEVNVVVYATDNSTNSSAASTYDLNGEYIQIDTTAPTIDVSYDNNTALTSGSMTLFKETRTATIVITERNFDPADVEITITNTDGTIPSTPAALSDWTKVTGTGNEDNTTWTAQIRYVADGDYTFAITYTDEAGNACTGTAYATGTVAAESFTIDRTLPTIAVTYDNNDAENSNYYAKSRTATITIVEHNFSSTGVTLTLNSYEEEDGDSKTGPAMTAWTTSGDVHTAQITFNEDGYYVFDIAYTDEAGNTASEYVGNNGTNGDNFTVDLTAPKVKFLDGAVDGGAYVGDVSPDFEISDNIALDIDTIEISLKKYTMDGELVDVDYSTFEGSSYNLDQHLTSYVLGNIPDADDGSNDGVYVLKVSVKDNAGNSSEDSITFSVNRHGSVFVVYALTDASGNAVKGTYTNSELAPIVIYEYNSNEVSEANRQVILIINGVETELSSDQYTVETVYDGNGWYKYIITILADNFSQDGTYRVQIISTDETDRTVSVVSDVNSTSADEAAISFTVDRTAPTIVMTNIADNHTETADSYLVKFHVTDNIGMSEIRVYVYDENSSKPTEATYIWSADPGENEMELNSDGDYEFTLTESNAHQIIEIEAVDLAGNVQTTLDDDDTNEDSVTTISGILITSNRWVQFVNNTPLFVGSIILLIILIALIIFLILWKRKKDKDKEQEKAKQEAANGAQKKAEAAATAKKSGKK